MSAQPRRILTLAESAAYIGKSTKTVRRYIKKGLLPGEMVDGKFGPEIRIPRKSLDSLARRMSTASNASDNAYTFLQLYREASPEIKELVMKILVSSPEDEEKVSRGSFLLPFFRKRGGEKL
jgi:predicted DNA-binding transcriptional regulator AlpA